MSKIPYFLKKFIEIKDILSDVKKNKVFKDKFTSCLTNKISHDKINEILLEIEKMKTIEIGIYTEKNLKEKIAVNQQECYDNKVINTVEQIKNDMVYYGLNNNDKKIDSYTSELLACICDYPPNYKKSLINNFFFKDEIDGFLKLNDSLYKINTEKVLVNLSEKKNPTNEIFIDKNYLPDYNFDSCYYYYIENKCGIKMKLALYVHFLIKFIQYKTKTFMGEEDEEELDNIYFQLRENYKDIYVISPFDDMKSLKLLRLEKKYNSLKKLTFKNDVIDKKISSINDPNIFNNINVKLNLNDLYKKEIDEINDSLKKFNSSESIIEKSNYFISTVLKSSTLIEKIGTNDYKSKTLINIILKLPLNFLLLTDNFLVDDKNIIKKIYTCFVKWIYICKTNNSINIYKYSYLLLINVFLTSNLKEFNDYKIDNIEDQKKKILEEFMIDINLSLLTSYKLFQDIQTIKSKLKQINIWYTDTISYQKILNHLYDLIIIEKKLSQNSDLELKSKPLIKTIIKQNDILTTKYLSDSNEIFDKLSVECDKAIDIQYFKKSTTIKSRELGIINSSPELNIESSTLIFKFINLDSLDLKKISNIFLMWIQMINNCKLTNLSESSFPYQFPNTSICELIVDESESKQINKITYKANYEIIEKIFDNKNIEISNVLNKLGTNTKNAYIDYFFNYISTDNSNYLNSMINPFINYGYELIKSDELIYTPVNYKNENNNTLIGLNSIKTKQNFIELLNVEKNNMIDKNDLNKLDPKQFNILFFVYTTIKNDDQIQSFISTNIDLLHMKLLKDDENIEIFLEKITNLDLKLIYITNKIKYYYYANKINKKNYKLNKNFYKLLDILTNISEKNFEPVDENDNEKILECNLYEKKLQYMNYSIPHLLLLNKAKINDLKKSKSLLRKFLYNPLNQFVNFNHDTKNLQNKETKENMYEIIEPMTFDNTMNLIDKSYKKEKIRRNFYLSLDATKLYPKKTKNISVKDIGFFVGDNDTKYFDDSDQYDYINIQNYKPEPKSELTLGQIIKIYPIIENLSFIEMFKYLLKLNQLNGNPNLKPKNSIDEKLYDIEDVNKKNSKKKILMNFCLL